MKYIIAAAFCFAIYYYLNKNKWDMVIEDKNLSKEEIISYAENISKKYKEVKKGRRTWELIYYIKRSFKTILHDYTILDNLSRNKKHIVPPGEWLLDNLYMIEKEYRTILSEVSRAYIKNLPVLSSSRPRIYQIAEDYISSRDSDFDTETFIEFIRKFQENTPLNIAELWVLPIMIKMALIDKISRISDKIIYIQNERIKGEEEAEKALVKLSEERYEIDTEKLQVKCFSKYYIISFEKILRDYGTEGTESYHDILKKMSINENDLNKLISEENKEEAVLKVNIGSLINSLRITEGLDIKDIFNSLSVVDRILNDDPMSLYQKLDFESKEHYRSAVERISRKYKIPEKTVSEKAVELAQQGENYKNHAGYYLENDGKYQLLSSFNIKSLKVDEKRKADIYIFVNIAGTLILCFAVIYLLAVKNQDFRLGKYVLAFFLSVIPFSEIVNSIINWSINSITMPSFIPKMEIKGDIPEEYRTIVAIPAIIRDKKQGKELIDSLEIYYLANEFKNLYFVLLSDYKDSKNENEESDSEITEECLKYIRELNEKYRKDSDIFYYLCRFRKYNSKEGKWLGWERKRGKLVEFNHLLRGDKNTSFNIISSNIEELTKAKYIITLDADTFLPKDAVKKLVGAMANPINRPVIDYENKVILRGYSLMQPRITVSTKSANKTPYSKIFSGETGFDIYTTAISDVYMDTFKEGIYTGKGIYDIDAFSYMTDDVIQENTVLSHDLLEGSLVRTALVTDVNLVDGYPASYNSGSKRLHRWVRGDWQLIKYLNCNKLNRLSKWKIIDNMRRSLLCPSIIVLLFISIIFFQYKEVYLAIAFVSFLIPIIFDVSETVVTPIKGIGLSGDVSKFKYVAEQFFLLFSFIPFQGYLMLDAIIRTLYRVFISKNKLLEWQTAEDMEKTTGREMKDFISLMWPGTLYSIIILIVSYYESGRIGIIMLLPCLLWIISPYTAYFISMENKEDDISLKYTQIDDLRKITRESYAYFQDFVNEKTKYIAPDNFQEEPNKNIALRTSPTNIGMTIISNIVAFDMGYIGLLELIDRLNDTISTMKNLKMYNGHFYNWYDLNDLMPLNPRYVSTVDSGNLAGYLMTASKALSDMKNGSIFNNSILKGINDTIALTNSEAKIELFPNYECENNLDKFYHFLLTIKSMPDEKGVKGYWREKLRYDLDKYIKEISYISDKENIVIKDEKLAASLDNIINYFDNLVEKMDFRILYNKSKELFSIGYNIDKMAMDNCYYDLLASEARQASFIAIAKGEVEVKHWFRLGRATAIMGNRKKGLVSWSGTMFEYFMPLLIMKNYKDSLLDITYKAVINGQKEYCLRNNIPWGISESAFYDFDINMIYQYKAFGVPGIGLKRGLSNELVISPYSSVMALMTDKSGAYSNLKKLEEIGAKGRYGFYEAIDYTHNIGRKNGKGRIVKCFMVHHLGMSLLSLDNVINENIMHSRFHSLPRVKSAELLLQEKAPKELIYRRKFNFKKEYGSGHRNSNVVRNYGTAKTHDVETLLLSNGSCHLMITNSGSGWSKNDKIFFYRWRRDAVKNDLGYFFYIRNIEEDNFYSSFYQPVKNEGDRYNVSFSLSSAEFSRIDKNLKTTTKITISPEDDVELRKITINNLCQEDIIIEVTSYMEITLSSYNSDLSHPAFSNLFISTEYDAETGTLIGRRRKRDPESKEEFLFQSIALSGEDLGDITYETSREKFIGRGRSLKNPQAMDKDKNLTNTIGAVIDPIFSIRKRLRIKKNKSTSIAFITAYAANLDNGMSLIKKYRDMGMVDRTFVLSKIEKEIELKYNSINASQANLYQLLASKIIFLSSKTEELENYINKIKSFQTDFWRYGISGDLPIITLILRDHKGMYLLKQILKAFNFLNNKGLDFDFIIEVKDRNSYEHPVWMEAVEETARIGFKAKGKVFVLKEDELTDEFRNLLYGSSRLLLDSDKGSLINGIRTKSNKLSSIDMNIKEAKCNKSFAFKKDELIFFNGYGGFNKKKENYTIVLNNYNNTPKPWVNIISNSKFGTMISELGGSYSFYKNSRENKLSSWSNDTVMDGEGELIYFRDEDGALASVTGKPIRDKGEYIIEHGFGYSLFKHYFMDLISEMTVFVPMEDNLKISLIKIKNNRNNDRKISAACYIDLVMGVNKENTAQYITTFINKEQDYIYAKNPYNNPFNNEIAYLKILAGENSYTGRREEFIGRNGALDNPEGLRKTSLSNKAGAGFDPCLSALSSFELKKDEEKWIIILLGEEDSLDKINNITAKYKDVNTVIEELEKTKKYWNNITGSIYVETEDEDFNLLLNGPLVYQVLSCRIWGRTGFYQCGGAYGFRDQLQDVMSLHFIRPDIERNHILLSASRQFEEGDVQHWWHPYVESGIRTRFSDDLLWLPYVVLDYINVTRDYSILKEEINYLKDFPLKEGEDERYNISGVSDVKEPILSHMIKAIDRSLKYGPHNLPLMGSGDWNDGMNTIGNKGKGESVWLAFFLCKILSEIIPVLKNENMSGKAEFYLHNLKFIKENIEKNAYDGSWYRRAYFDDGTPIGSISSGECKIDSLSQSWAVISGAADPERAKTSMDSLEKNLYLKDKGLILLLSPPFNKWEKEPGYIKGYVPGVRENGGQYTHGAIWAVLAEVMLNKGNMAYEMYRDLNPINHSKTKLESDIYMVEPYIMTADIYAKEPYTGRGGWSFYTGAAGWMYRVGLEGILGFKIEGNIMKIEPCIPDRWKEFKLDYITDKYNYKISVIKDVSKGIFVDGIKVDKILLEEGKAHRIVVKI